MCSCWRWSWLLVVMVVVGWAGCGGFDLMDWAGTGRALHCITYLEKATR